VSEFDSSLSLLVAAAAAVGWFCGDFLRKLNNCEHSQS
jgi:hypothetical protein